ncbi:MAG: hypothetical protein CM15mP62_27870 [Rhodospirillaceae bacterium]|nr:MAG: hypothetical protein CM15mP62_27870 [Rhodospirillaceae bacterium]
MILNKPCSAKFFLAKVPNVGMGFCLADKYGGKEVFDKGRAFGEGLFKIKKEAPNQRD